jgi:hypothetical protein
MERLIKYLVDKGYNLLTENDIPSWELIKDIDNWVVIEYGKSDNGPILLYHRFNGKDIREMAFTKRDIDLCLYHLENLREKIWADVIRDEKIDSILYTDD